MELFSNLKEGADICLKLLINKFKEVSMSVLPISLIVILINFTIVPLKGNLLSKFLLGSVLVIVGLVMFLTGVDNAIIPLGEEIGSFISKKNKLWIVILAGLILGFFISVAEPALIVLSNQVSSVTSYQISSIIILVTVSVGLSVMLTFGFLRIFYNIALHKLLFVIYILIAILSLFASKEFLAISFDASGATTGVLAVPFILALSVGISNLKKDSKASEEDSFGLVALASSGAIIGVLLLDLFSKTQEFIPSAPAVVDSTSPVIYSFIKLIGPYFKESVISILPLFIIFVVLSKVAFKISKNMIKRITIGFVFAFIGLLIFLSGINGGFMDVGTIIGERLVMMNNKLIIIIISFILGVVTIIAEPAVYVLTHQIEDVTGGYVRRKSVLVSLAVGVGAAISLSVIRILTPGLDLWSYLLPGYIIALGLMFITPKLFVGIAFDAGGVATGPITATFIMAFIQGAAHAYPKADILVDGFGMIAMVAMMPIITLQILGLIFEKKSRKKIKNETKKISQKKELK